MRGQKDLSDHQSDSFAFLDATAQAELVRSKEVSPLELVDSAIRRIERLNPTLNAVVTPLFKEARKQAIAGSGTRGGGASKGRHRSDTDSGSSFQPFFGVPFLIKDLSDIAGVKTTFGSRFVAEAGYVADQDNEIVRRFKETGVIILGKTNTPELGLLPTTEPKLFGAARNPWDLDRTAGGSSGGAAAAVAAGMVPFAHANDGGGSIRIPASCCGLFGFKPSRARTPTNVTGLVSEHVLTRSVRDSAAMLDAIHGPDEGARYWAPPPRRPFIDEVTAAKSAGAGSRRLRVAFLTRSLTGSAVDPACVEAVKDAACLLEELGHVVEEIDPPIDGARITEDFMTLWAASCAANITGLADMTRRKPDPQEFEPLTWALYEWGLEVRAKDLLRTLEGMRMETAGVDRLFQTYDVWLTPTLGSPPVPLGSFEPDPSNPLETFDRTNAFVPFTPVINVTGQPAMSVPLYWTDDGLPIGTHFVGRFGDDGTLFYLASQLEEARPWAQKLPPSF